MKFLKRMTLVVFSFLFLNFGFITFDMHGAQLNCENEIKSALCEDSEKGEVYKNYDKYKLVLDHHETSNPIGSGFNILGWWLIQGLATVSNILNDVNDFLYKTTKDFIESDYVGSVGRIIQQISLVSLPIMLLVLAYLGMNGKQAQVKQGIMQLFIAVVFMNGVGYIYEKGFELIPAMDSIFKTETQNKYADELLLDSIIDIEYLKEMIDDGQDVSGRKNNMSVEELRYIDVNRPAPYEKTRWLGMVKEYYFNRAIVGWDNDNNVPLLRAYDSNGLWGWGKTYIHQYNIPYIEIILSLFFLLVGQLFIEWKRVQLLLDIGVSKVFSPFVAVRSITDKQKLMQFLTKIFQLFSALMLTTFSITYYIKFSSYIASANINFFAKLPLLYANLLFLFKSGDVVRLIFGVSTGTKTGFMGKYLGARALTSASRFAGSTVKSGVNKYRAYKDGMAETNVKNRGSKFGDDLARSRENFLNEQGTTIDDYKDIPHLQSDYEYQPVSKEEVARMMHGGETEKGYQKNLKSAEKHLQAFNEAGKQAYEQKFPSYKERRYTSASKDDFERRYPTKYKRDLAAEKAEKEGKRFERKSDFSDQEIKLSQEEIDKLWEALDNDV